MVSRDEKQRGTGRTSSVRETKEKSRFEVQVGERCRWYLQRLHLGQFSGKEGFRTERTIWIVNEVLQGVTTIGIVSGIRLDLTSCVWKGRLGNEERLFIKLLKSAGMVEDGGRECCGGLNKALRTMGKGGRN